jgi:plastocyanin
MLHFKHKTSLGLFGTVAAACALAAPSAHANPQQWTLDVGAQSSNAARQAMAFLTNEIWINEGDSITWTSRAGEGHTVTFVPDNQLRPGFGPTGPATSPSPSVFDNSSTVNSGTLCDGSLQQTDECDKPVPGTKTFTVSFPKAGNYVFVCLIHPDMTGTVHVLAQGTPLPHRQGYYTKLAAAQAHDLLGEDGTPYAQIFTPLANDRHEVVTPGEVAATGGGKQYQVLMRFLPDKIYIRKGDTVEWTNTNPVEPHSVTFVGPGATEPGFPAIFGLINGTTDADSASHGTISDPNAAYVFSDLIQPAAQYQGNQLQLLPHTRTRVTFTKAGTYDYFCALHDELGMKGTVVVLP